MSKVEAILYEIKQLSKAEQSQLEKALRENWKVGSWKSKRGVARGVWEKDAQDYINDLREDERS